VAEDRGAQPSDADADIVQPKPQPRTGELAAAAAAVTAANAATPRSRHHVSSSDEAMPTSRALVLFSGGQDSTTCLAWALDRFDAVETIGFDYGQRHAVEMRCRPDVLRAIRAAFPHWAKKLGDDTVLDLRVLGAISDTALTGDKAIELRDSGLPNTFVPGRNLLFFTLAGAVAYRRGIAVLVAGMCETDYSGYPDCRDNTIKAMQLALNLGMDQELVIETPLMHIDKAATWAMAERLGGPPLIDILVRDTHSCYLGERTSLHVWGYGCTSCPACELRAAGYRAFAASGERSSG
jgi:7-cyano-7-deazaguanine synthase